jgi:hypothetical protein
MRLGAHLPVADFGDGLPTATALRDYVLAARDTGSARSPPSRPTRAR